MEKTSKKTKKQKAAKAPKRHKGKSKSCLKKGSDEDDNPFSKEHNKDVFRFFDKDDKIITYFEEDKALKLFKDKQEIYVCIYYLDGLSVYKYYKIKLEE